MFSNRESSKSFFDYVKQSKPRSINHKMLSRDDFLNGSVAQIEFNIEGSDSSAEPLVVWVVLTKQHKGYADSESQLIQQLQAATKNIRKKYKIDWVGIISGIISIILVSSLVILILFKSPSDVPNYLVTLVSTIMAFYFGGVVKGKTDNVDEQS